MLANTTSLAAPVSSTLGIEHLCKLLLCLFLLAAVKFDGTIFNPLWSSHFLSHNPRRLQICREEKNCNYVCVQPLTGCGLAHRLANAAQGALLSCATGFSRADVSFEGVGAHGGYAEADDLFFLESESSKSVKCLDFASNLTVIHVASPPKGVQNDTKMLKQWVRNMLPAGACGYLVIVKEFWFASYEPVWHQVQELYHPFSVFGSRLQLQLQYSQDVINIAIHVRTGDITPTPLSYFAPCLNNLLTKMMIDKAIKMDVWLFSETKLPDLEVQLGLVVEAFLNVRLRLEARDGNPLLTFVHMTEADIFFASKSGFSYFAALMTQKRAVVIAPNGICDEWGLQFQALQQQNRVNLQQIIFADENGTFVSDSSSVEKGLSIFSH